MKALFSFVLGAMFLCAGCHRAGTPAGSSQNTSTDDTSAAVASVNGATISASPNPIVHGPEEGETTINWDTHENGAGEVSVSRNGAPEQLFAKAAKGSRTVKWIRAGLRYEFSLYQMPSHKILSKVQVTHQR